VADRVGSLGPTGEVGIIYYVNMNDKSILLSGTRKKKKRMFGDTAGDINKENKMDVIRKIGKYRVKWSR
jgi:hypothetical protein